MFDIYDLLNNEDDCFCPYCRSLLLCGKKEILVDGKTYFEYSIWCDCAHGFCSPLELERFYGIRSSLCSNETTNYIIAYREYLDNLERIQFRFSKI